MRLIERFTRDLSSRRAQHLVYVLHVWLCVPFLFVWLLDRHTKDLFGESTIAYLRGLIVGMLVYMAVRTWIAYRDPDRLKWWLVFPPIDVAWITAILAVTHRGPMSNITLLFFLPMVQASGALNVRWSFVVGFLVIIGTSIATLTADRSNNIALPTTVHELLQDPVNVTFRIYFLLIISSLMAYQALIAAGLKERLGIAADRTRIAMEMHDGVQGHLISISSQLELISRVAQSDGNRAAELAAEGREGARQAADELRFLVQRLRAPALSQGFVPALRQYAHNICDRHQLQLEFNVKGQEFLMPPETENAVFRIAQESLANVVKHSLAKSVSVEVEFLTDIVLLCVTDDGIGFDLEDHKNGIGLEGMQMRAKDGGGEVKVESSANAGTIVRAAFRMEATHG